MTSVPVPFFVINTPPAPASFALIVVVRPGAIVTIIVAPGPKVLAATPLIDTVPSSTVRPFASTTPLRVTMKGLVASEPAEKTAVSLFTKVVTAEVPVSSVPQLEVVVS
jgi:hypothetical protein